MGWNSWDCYGASVTEKELRQNIDYMAGHLRDHGRLMPAPNRFPSAANGKGFKEIADYTHSKGLKFGIHIMRGIPRQAVAQNVKIKDSKYTAREAAHPSSICCWNTDMYGLDTTKPGAQDYYDSILELYASWGVDFIKVDDICVKYGRPGDESTLKYGGDEIEMFRRCNNWSPYVSQGCYTDCDMLPVGHISIRGCEHGLTDRQTRLSKEEQECSSGTSYR